MGKRVTIYVLINIILLLISILLVYVLVTRYNTNKKNMPIELAWENSTIVQSIQAEYDENKAEEKTNITAVVPKIVEDNQENMINTNNAYFKYYYEQLDSNSKKIYDCIENNIENIKTGTYKIKLPNEVAKVLEEENGNEKLGEQFQSAWDAILMDRVDLFFIDITKLNLEMKITTYGKQKTYSLVISPGSTGNYLDDGFYSEQIVDMSIDKINKIRDQIISELSGDDYNKVKQVHNWIIDNLEYGMEKSDNNAYNIYGALINKEAVCEGYAETFKYVMDAIGIPSILVIGTATNSEGITENHEWNYVKIDGIWYGIDVTWDDPIIKGGGFFTNSVRYKYFLKGKDDMDKNHFPNGKVSSRGMSFKYLELGNSY